MLLLMEIILFKQNIVLLISHINFHLVESLYLILFNNYKDKLRFSFEKYKLHSFYKKKNMNTCKLFLKYEIYHIF